MKICFVLLHAYPVVEPTAPGVFGGSETRAVTIARGMARYTNHEICFIVRNPELKKPRLIDGVMYIPWRDFWTEVRLHVAEHLDINALPKIRINRWSWKLLWEIPLLALALLWRRKLWRRKLWRKKNRDPRSIAGIFQEVNADIYCSFGINAHAVQTVYNAKSLKRASLLLIGHDMDLDERIYPGSDYISPYRDYAEPSYWVLKNAERIIAQTAFQQQLLKDRFDRDCDLLANPFDLENWQESMKHSDFENPWGTEKYILWIGRAEEVHKKPSQLVELASRSASQKFVMIMNPSHYNVEKQIKQQAPENVKIIDAVPFSQMPGAFCYAKAFVNTSSQEGFPNVFLQAIASQVPIISYEVGEEFLKESQAGICVRSDANLASQLLLDQTLAAKTNQEAAMMHLRENNLCSAVCRNLAKIMEGLA